MGNRLKGQGERERPPLLPLNLKKGGERRRKSLGPSGKGRMDKASCAPHPTPCPPHLAGCT